MTRVTRRAVAALASAAALSVALTACGSGDDSSSKDKKSGASALPSVDPKTVPTALPKPASDKDLAKLPAEVASDGTTVVVGSPKAKNTLQVFEDPRCPFCKQFEITNGAQLAAAVAKGKLKIEYTLASFLDKNLGGQGSVRAVNALRASVKEKKFPQYHAELYQNQPDEKDTNAFTDADLLKLAGKIPDLKSPAFTDAVKKNTYKSFVADSEKAFEKSGANSTPTIKLNGKNVDQNNLMDPVKFAQVLEAAKAR